MNGNYNNCPKCELEFGIFSVKCPFCGGLIRKSPVFYLLAVSSALLILFVLSRVLF
ncbi:MAG: hypothetical protein R2684_07135 [Pyrinomonadaceae bacterium]